MRAMVWAACVRPPAADGGLVPLQDLSEEAIGTVAMGP